MKNQHADQNDACPLDELSPELRQIVAGIAREMPPEELMQRVLDGMRRQEPTEAGEWPQPLERRQGRRSITWSFSAASALVVAVCTMILVAVSSSHLRIPVPEVVLQMPMAVNQDLPTAWAYHKAIAESPQAMDALLARHARQLLCPEARPMLAQTFPNLLQPMP
jgi:hypothetical protein